MVRSVSACPGVVAFLLFLGLWHSTFARGEPVDFDVRQHLSTSSRYGAGKALAGHVEDVPPVPPSCEPIHLNLVARHGTRSPTKSKIKAFEVLASRLAKQVEDEPQGNAKRPAWLYGFRSPWEGLNIGGELVRDGEEDMYHLGQRVKKRFPQLFKYDYHPEIYPITATQVARSAASAVAFGMGLFEGTGSLGGSKQRAFSVITDSRKDDIHLRFHESCMAYKASKALRKPAVQGWQDEAYLEVGASISSRHGLNLSTEDTQSLWNLCRQEASIFDITDRACELFSTAEVELMEWADDVEAHCLKGYGETVNYRMGVPLLQEVVTTMDEAIESSRKESPGIHQVAKLRIAHAETVIPFTCLLGLFLENPDVESLQTEEPMNYPRKPPHQRLWKGSLVAPFGANTQLILYKCTEEQVDEYLVQVLHNEKPVTMPACKGAHFCPFQTFKDTVAGPHLKYTFENVCSIQPKEEPEQKLSRAQKFLQTVRAIFQWPCSHSPTAHLSDPVTEL